METEYAKRAYQGVRVKHTVKDLLAEKRSRQTAGPRYSGGSAPQPSYVQMPGSPLLPGYYGMSRRSFLSDSDFCPSDAYPPAMGSKPLGGDPAPAPGYPSLPDGYYPETLGDYRGATPFPGAGAIFPSSALSSLLPPFTPDSAHFLLRESWEQSSAECVPQGEVCVEGLPSPAPPTASPAHYPSPGRGPAQPYPLPPLDDPHYPHAPYPTPPSFPCHPYMTGPSELPSRIPPLGSGGSDGPLHPHGEPPSWGREDGGGPWSPYEPRRSY